MDKQSKLTALYYKYDKGLVPANSDLHFALSYIKELQDENKRIHSERVDRRAEEVVRDNPPGRSKKKRVRKGSAVRSEGSTTENLTMEGGA